MSHLKDPYQPTTTMQCNMGFVFLHCKHVSFQTSSVLLDILDFDQSQSPISHENQNASTTQTNHPKCLFGNVPPPIFSQPHYHSLPWSPAPKACILQNAPHVYTWGLGLSGRLGHGDENDRLTPTFVEALTGMQVPPPEMWM